jgi:hypothetical protein
MASINMLTSTPTHSAWVFTYYMHIFSCHHNKMRLSSLWVSLDFEWICTFLPSEIIQLSNEQGPIVTINELFH